MTNISKNSLRDAAFLIPAVCLASVLTLPAVGQTTRDFIAVGTGAWETTSNWSGSTLPTSVDTANFNSASIQTATLSGPQTIRAITVSTASKTLQGAQTLSIGHTSTASSINTSTLGLDQVTLSKSGTANFNLTSATINLLNGGAYVQSNGALALQSTGLTSQFTGSGTVTLSRASGAIISYGSANNTLTIGSGVTANFNSGSVSFSTGGGSVLNNSGTLNLTGATFNTSAGALNNNSGTLNVGSTIKTLGAGSSVSLTGGTYQLSITGDSAGGGLGITTTGIISLSLNPVLSVTSVDVTDGATFTILNAGAGSVSGTFSGLTDNSVFTAGAQDYRINYLGSSVTLTAVPEPQHYAGAIGLGLVAFTAFRRSRRTA